MAPKNVCKENARNFIIELRGYRSGWANEIREGWDFASPGSKKVLYELYSISGVIILVWLDILNGHRNRDKVILSLAKDRLNDVVKSPDFQILDQMGQVGCDNVVTNGTKHHIRVMFDCLDFLVKQ